MMHYLWLFLAGALVCNAIPHLAAGLRGERFQSPFATPRGVGESSPLLNFYWGSANLAGGVALMICWLPAVSLWIGLGMVALGWLALGSYCSRHFGKVRG